MRFVSVLLLLLAVPLPIWGQNSVDQQLYHFLLLERQGQFASAIPGLQSIADSGTLNHVEQGRAWTILGIACKETGQFQQAQSAFEKAINLFEGDAEHQSDLANALDFSAELYQSIGQTQTAGKMWSRVLTIYEKKEDHRALMKTYAHLAANELERKHSRAARALMGKAMAETTSSLSDDDRAFLCDTQGWIDEKT